MKNRSYMQALVDKRVAIGLFIWWLINLLQAAFTELAHDEAYYFMFSQQLDWGYFDHPPMTALLIWLGSFMGGEFGVRFSSRFYNRSICGFSGASYVLATRIAAMQQYS